LADHPDAVAETERLAQTLTFDLSSDLGYRYPGAEDADADAKLAEVCAAIFATRYPRGSALHDQAVARLDEELRVIRALGLSGFFLLHRDLLELAREVAADVRGTDTVRALLPPGRGRGSSVSSIVCYLTGLSHVDPVKNDLFLGRFLNEELTSLPDIDLDFPRDIREVLIPRVHERYGRDYSALVAAFPTYRARGAIRELGKALGLPPGEIERVARSSEGWSARNVGDDIATALGEGRDRAGRWAWLARLAEEAHGLPRRTSASRRRTPPGSSRSRAVRRWGRCGARGRRAWTTSRSRWRSCVRGRSKVARSTRTSSAASACASTRTTRFPTSTRRWSPC